MAEDSEGSSAVYQKSVICPVCDKGIKVKAVKSSSVRVLSRDSDFMIYYRDPSPSIYEVWHCPNCGYAALSTKFDSISKKQREAIRDQISAKWSANRNYPELYDIDTSIELHLLALLSTSVKQGPDSEKSLVCLKTAWLYRLKKDTANENKYLNFALQGFLKAFEKENFPVAGMDEATLVYLVGELYRRLGDNTNALFWFSKVLTGRNYSNKIKDMAREQKDLIKTEA